MSKLQGSNQRQNRLEQPDMGSSSRQGLAHSLSPAHRLGSVTASDHYLDWLGCMPDLWASTLQAEQWNRQFEHCQLTICLSNIFKKVLQADLDLSGCKPDWLVSKLQQAATTEASAPSKQAAGTTGGHGCAVSQAAGKASRQRAGMQLRRRRLQLHSRCCEDAAQYLD